MCSSPTYDKTEESGSRDYVATAPSTHCHRCRGRPCGGGRRILLPAEPIGLGDHPDTARSGGADGEDSRHGDPLGHFQVADADFADLTRIVREIADQYANGHVVSILEGGYNLSGLASASSAHVEAMLA